MKIKASVQVVYRVVAVHNKKDNRPTKSTLTLTMSPSPKKEVCIIHQCNQFPTGRKYKVLENIEVIFIKFINEGKSTIRFKVPEHDLIITSDPLQLKSFMVLLKRVLKGETPLKELKLSSLSSTGGFKELKSEKTKLFINAKSDYPVIEGFPRTLEILVVNNINMVNLDRKITTLRNLRILDLNNNSLDNLPAALGSMNNLVELHLKNNKLGLGCNWSFLKSSAIQNNLCLLDLQNNKISSLPENIRRLKNLVTLRLDINNLETLPRGIGNLKKLRNLTVRNNNLQYLPGSIRMLRLSQLDVSENKFCSTSIVSLCPTSFGVMSLLNIAAKQVLLRRIPYSEETVPANLIELMETCSFCACGSRSFSNIPNCYINFDVTRISSQITFDSTYTLQKCVPIETNFCCYKCARSAENRFGM